MSELKSSSETTILLRSKSHTRVKNPCHVKSSQARWRPLRGSHEPLRPNHPASPAAAFALGACASAPFLLWPGSRRQSRETTVPLAFAAEKPPEGAPEVGRLPAQPLPPILRLPIARVARDRLQAAHPAAAHFEPPAAAAAHPDARSRRFASATPVNSCPAETTRSVARHAETSPASNPRPRDDFASADGAA